MGRRWWAVAAVGVLAGCAGPASRGSTTTAAPTTSAGVTTTTASACDPAGRLEQWSVEARAAQLVVLPVLDFDLEGLTPSIRTGAGGVIFLGRARAPADLRDRLVAAAGPDADAAGRPIAMADEEGGDIQRLQGAVDDFPSAREQAATMTAGEVEQLGEQVGAQMSAIGITMDLAPVLDLDDRPGPSATNPDGTRSYGIDPDVAGSFGVAFAQGLRAAGVVPVVKHFPGIGGSTTNTDVGAAPTRPLAELRAGALLPFETAVDAGGVAVMVANSTVPGLTDRPASVSSEVVDGLLRDELGFDGLVVTDSLSAGAIRDAGLTVPEAAAAAIAAGADLLLFGSTLTPEDTLQLRPDRVEATRAEIVAAIAAAVADGTISAARLDEAVAHVLATKKVDPCEVAIRP